MEQVDPDNESMLLGADGQREIQPEGTAHSRGEEVEGWLVSREPWDWGLGLKVRQRRPEVGEVGCGGLYTLLWPVDSRELLKGLDERNIMIRMVS